MAKPPDHDPAPPAEVDLIERQTVFQGYFRVDQYRLRHEQYAGGFGPEIKREVLERGHAVAVLGWAAVDARREVREAVPFPGEQRDQQ